MRDHTPHMHRPWNQIITGASLFVLLLLALVQYTSNGIVRSGGDDEGSGIGGTGRMLSPSGESGIGGTGFKPYLGMNTNQEIEILRHPVQMNFAIVADISQPNIPPAPISPVVTRVERVMRGQDLSFNSSPIDISEAVQVALDIQARALAQLRSEILLIANTELAESDGSDVNSDAVMDRPMKWQDVAALLEKATNHSSPQSADTNATNLANLDTPSEESARITRPERIQRPELPPMQRVTPLQRTAILPPRVQPLRL